MKRFDIYRNGDLIAENVQAEDEHGALALYADSTGIDGPIKRDGGGKLYVGDAQQGRYYARFILDPAELAAWRARYPHSPFGTPTVFAEAVEQIGGLA